MTPVLTAETGTMAQLLEGCTWEAQAYRRVLALKDLPDTWDRPGSVKPTISAVNAALWYIARVARMELFVLGEPFIAPTPHGGVQLEWDHGERQLEIELLPDGSARFLTSDAGEMEEGDLDGDPSSRDVETLLGWLAVTP
jgi:hypothetical protein